MEQATTNTAAAVETGAAQDPVKNPPQINGATNTTPPGAPKQGDVAQAAAEAMRKYKVKVEGQELEVDEKELLRGYSHQRAASKALNEGKLLRKQAEEAIAMLKDKEKLKDVLKKLGHDPRKLSEEILAAHLEDELMDPKDKQLRDLQNKVKAHEEKILREKEAIEKQALQRRTEAFRAKYEKEFVETLEKSKLPKTKETVARMAGYIARCAKIGYEITPDEAAVLLEDDLKREHQAISMDADVEAIIKLYGEDFINKIRKYDTSRLKNPESGLSTPVIGEIRKPREPKKRMSPREWQLHKRGLK